MSDVLAYNPGQAMQLETAAGAYPSGLVGTIDVAVRALSDRSYATAPSTAGIAYDSVVGSYWIDTLLAPTTGGSYDIVWNDHAGNIATQRVVVGSTSPIIPPASLAANALTDVGSALVWLRRQHVTGQASADDATVLTLLINGVSQAIQKHCERQFVPQAAATHTFSYNGNGLINISPFEVRTITSLTVGGIALVAGTGLGDGTYLPRPRDKSPEGTYLWIDTSSYVYHYPRNATFLAPLLNQRDAVIVGDFGMAAIPADVTLAALIAVADMYRNPEQAATRGSGDFQISEVQDGGGDPLPPESVKLLAPYVRPRLV